MVSLRTAICGVILLLTVAPIPDIFRGKLKLSPVSQVVGQTPMLGIIRDGVPDPAHGLTVTGSSEAPGLMHASLLQTDGKVLIGGEFDHVNGVARRRLTRLNADGSVDVTFNTGSILEGPVLAIARQADGKYVVAGSTSTFGQKALWRLNEDGSRDTSFQQTILNTTTWVQAVAIQSDGKIVIGGGFTSVNGQARHYVARLNADGSLDDFQPDVANGGPTRINALIIQSDGKIVLGGSFSTINGTSGIRNLARVMPDGAVDAQFSTNEAGLFTEVKSITEINGSLYIGSRWTADVGNLSRFGLVRLNSDGMVDLSFSLVWIAAGNVYSVIPTDNGKLLVGGDFETFALSGSRNAIIRILENGALDYTFDAGRLTTNNSTGPITVDTVVQFYHDRLFIGGYFHNVGSYASAGAAALTVGRNVTRAIVDFNGDAKTDVGIFRPQNSVWYWLPSGGSPYTSSRSFGSLGDRITPADFDGDGVSEVSVYRPVTGTWYWLNSSNGAFNASQFGVEEDLPTPGDYDGDGRADLSVFRPSIGTWYRLNSSNGTFSGIQFGASEDKPTIGDFDGDGKADIAVFRPSTGAWYRINSGDASIYGELFGFGSDVVAPADYDGDGNTDIAVYRSSTGVWYLHNSSDASFSYYYFGLASDTPAPADFDGDGKADICVFRPAEGNWYRQNSSNGAFVAFHFGANGDKPTMTAFRY
jgi:uncharacterized delta-60 repeat protein